MRISDWSSDVCSSDLATTESVTHEVFRDKMIAASSRDTIRSKHRTGKYSRQLRSGWHAMWEEAALPALPMPLMMLLSEPVLRAIDRAAVNRSEEHTSELQSLMRSSYAVFCLKKKNNRKALDLTNNT